MKNVNTTLKEHGVIYETSLSVPDSLRLKSCLLRLVFNMIKKT